jgi:hypothetical protein
MSIYWVALVAEHSLSLRLSLVMCDDLRLMMAATEDIIKDSHWIRIGLIKMFHVNVSG